MRRQIDRIEGAYYERGYVYSFHFHLIWGTKYRRQVFTTPALVSEMKGIIRHVAEVSWVTIEEMEVIPDHVHMFISFRPKHAPTDVVKNLKGASARIFLAAHPEIRKACFWGGHLWSSSYYMSTLGSISRDTVEDTSGTSMRQKKRAIPPPDFNQGRNCLNFN